jgi:pimeloyl-ACP methyl ester carboxylesterase
MEHLIVGCKVPVERIIIVGRSIGTGPAAILASKYKAMCAILVSAYKSIKEVGMNLVGTLGYFLLKQKWPIISLISKVECPILLIHGKKDVLIPYSHSVSLHNVCKSGESQLLIFDDMDHNTINYEYHIKQPFNRFISEVDKNPGCLPFTFNL